LVECWRNLQGAEVTTKGVLLGLVLAGFVQWAPVMAADSPADLRAKYDVCVLKAALTYLDRGKHDDRIRETVAGKCNGQLQKVRAALLEAGIQPGKADQALARMQEGAFRAAATYMWAFVFYRG
jgi:hypothetical protein